MKKRIAVMMTAVALSFAVQGATAQIIPIPAVEVQAKADKNVVNAYKAAKNYLEIMPFSRQGLIDQLSSEYGDKYTVSQATKAVKKLEKNKEVNWKKQAVRAAEDYLDTMPFSRQGLIDQLSSEYGGKFTVKQATYAVNQVGL